LTLAAAAAAEMREIEVDATRTIGEIKPLAGLAAPAEASLREELLEFEGLMGVPWLHLPAGDPLTERFRAQGYRIASADGPAYDLGSSHDPLDLNRLENGSKPTLIWSFLGQFGPYSAALTASALTYLQDTAAATVYYQPSELRTAGGRLSAQLQALRFCAQMTYTPGRLPVRGDDRIGLAVLAGRSIDGRTVQVLISNFERRKPPDAKPGELAPRPEEVFDYKDNSGYVLSVQNLPWGAASFRVERYQINDLYNGDLVRRGSGRGGRFQHVQRLPPPGVELVVLSREDVPMSEGIVRRRTR
jgi:hypothetical protein